MKNNKKTNIKLPKVNNNSNNKMLLQMVKK